MAVLEPHRPGTGLRRSIAAAIGAVATWNDARVTRDVLTRLTTRELHDIGLGRGDIGIDALSRR